MDNKENNKKKEEKTEEQSPKNEKAKQVPVLPLRDIIIFPHMVVPLFVGREKSIHALDKAMNEEKDILLITQINAKTNDP